MIDLHLYNIIDLAYICFCRATIRAIFPGRILARISDHVSTLPKISRFWLCLRAVYDVVSLCFRNALVVRCKSKQYRNPGQDISGKNGMYGQPNFYLVMPDKEL